MLVQEKGLMFLAMSEMKIATRLDSYITNVSIMKRDFFLIVYDAMGYEADDSESSLRNSGCSSLL